MRSALWSDLDLGFFQKGWIRNPDYKIQKN